MVGLRIEPLEGGGCVILQRRLRARRVAGDDGPRAWRLRRRSTWTLLAVRGGDS